MGLKHGTEDFKKKKKKQPWMFLGTTSELLNVALGDSP